MAKKPGKTETPPEPEAAMPSPRERLLTAFLELLAEKRFEAISLNDVAGRAGMPLSEMREIAGSTFDLVSAFAKSVDTTVLKGTDPAMREEPARERLFDVLMRRIDTLSPHKEAVRSMLASARRDANFGLALNRLAVRSMQWMLAAADIDANGPAGALRAQGLALLFARVLAVWVDDDDPGLARTLAALDKQLANGGRCATMLDDLMRMNPFCRLRARRSGLDDIRAA
jgi:AcrR family transcriptional regulator